MGWDRTSITSRASVKVGALLRSFFDGTVTVDALLSEFIDGSVNQRQLTMDHQQVLFLNLDGIQALRQEAIKQFYKQKKRVASVC